MAIAGPAFRLFGIPIRIDPTFFVIVAFMGIFEGLRFLLIWIPLVTVSVLVHELGHGVAFRAFGKQPQILLQGMGGLTSAPGTLPPGRELVVSLAGPLTGLVLIGLPALWLDARVPNTSADVDLALRILVFVNIAWSVVNLLPVLPLDGGRVTASVIHVVTRRPSDRAAHAISVVVAGAAAVWAYAEGQIFIAMFAGFFLAYNLSQLSQSRARDRATELSGGYQALFRGDDDEALEVARRVAATSGSAVAVTQALELQAWARLRRDDPDGAETALRRLPPQASATKFLAGCLELAKGGANGLATIADGYAAKQMGPWSVLAAALVAERGLLDALEDRLALGEEPGARLLAFQSDLHHAGRFHESAKVGERAFALASSTPEGDGDASLVAYNAACSLSRAGRLDEAMTWLERAVDHGFADRQLLEQDPDLEALRYTAGFELLRSRLP